MTKERAYFEMLGLKKHSSLCPDHVPQVFHFDRTMSLIAMRYLEPPHIILRKGIIAGIEYPLLSDHMSEFLARTLFFTSLIYLSSKDHRREGEWWIAVHCFIFPPGYPQIHLPSFPYPRSFQSCFNCSRRYFRVD